MSTDAGYVYAGKGWEPKVGDVCEVTSGSEWFECTIVELGNPNGLPHPFSDFVDYTIDIPGHPCMSGDSPLWLCRTSNLRKRLPPKQKASEDSFEEIMDYFKSAAEVLDEVEA